MYMYMCCVMIMKWCGVLRTVGHSPVPHLPSLFTHYTHTHLVVLTMYLHVHILQHHHLHKNVHVHVLYLHVHVHCTPYSV